MAIRVQRRLKVRGGLGVNVGKSSGSVSYRSRFGSLGTKGYSVRSGIPGLYWRGSWGRRNPIGAFVGLFVVLGVGLVKLITAIVGLVAGLFRRPRPVPRGADPQAPSTVPHPQPCVRCGSPLLAGDHFCASCGEPRGDSRGSVENLVSQNFSGRFKTGADEVAYLTVPECSYEHRRRGVLHITSRRIYFEYQGGSDNWPLKYVLSCKLEEPGFILSLSDRVGAPHLTTGDPKTDSLIAALVQQLVPLRIPGAVQALPQDAQAWAALGAAQAAVYGTSERAIESLERAVRLKPDLGGAWGVLGNQYYCSGRTDEAIQALDRAVRLQPQNANAWADLGGAYAEKGDYHRGSEALNLALKFDRDRSPSGVAIRQLWEAALSGMRSRYRH